MEESTHIIVKIKDNVDDDVYLKIIFNKIKSKNTYFCEAKAIDSKDRYFYAKKLTKDYEYYANKCKNMELNDVYYYDYYDFLSIFLEKGSLAYSEFALDECNNNIGLKFLDI